MCTVMWITPCKSKKITNMVFTRDFWNRSFFRPWRGFSNPFSGLTFSDRIVGKTPRLIASYNFLKEVRITVCCGHQISASCNSPGFLLWSQRVWNKARTNLPFSQIFNYKSFSLCPCQCSPRLLAFLAKGDGFEATTEKSTQHCCHCDTL